MALTAATPAAGAMRGRPLVAGPVVAGAGAVDRRPVVNGRTRAMERRPVVNGRARTVDKARVTPAMPSGGAAPAGSAPLRKATLVPAWAAPSRIVPAVTPTAPNELRLFDQRAFGERSRWRKRADAKRRIGGKGKLRDHASRYAER